MVLCHRYHKYPSKWGNRHESSCITGFLSNAEAVKLQSSGGKCNHLGLRSHPKNMILLAKNHLILQGNPGNKGGYFSFLNFSIACTVLALKTPLVKLHFQLLLVSKLTLLVPTPRVKVVFVWCDTNISRTENDLGHTHCTNGLLYALTKIRCFRLFSIIL